MSRPRRIPSTRRTPPSTPGAGEPHVPDVMRRFIRLTNALSKKLENRAHLVGNRPAYWSWPGLVRGPLARRLVPWASRPSGTRNKGVDARIKSVHVAGAKTAPGQSGRARPREKKRSRLGRHLTEKPNDPTV